MKILISQNWETLDIDKGPPQNDLDVFNNEEVQVVVYGFPYFVKEDKWCSAEDAFIHYKVDNKLFVEEIDGIYSIVFIDKAQKNCKVITDRYGVYSLFYTTDGTDRIAIADNLKDIANLFDELLINKTSVIEYLNYNIKLGTKTHFKNAKKFDGGSIYTVENNLEISRQKYWDLLKVDDTARMSDEEFTNVFNKHFEKACQLGKKIALPLTGGRDSRVILSACLPHKEKITSYTHGPKYHTDVKQAETISQYLELPHKHYKINNKFGKKLLKRAENNTAIFDGQYSFLDYLHVKRSYEKESKNADLLLTGILGNQLYRHHPIGSSLPENGSIDETAKHIVKRLPSVFFFRTNLLDFYNDLFNGLDKNDLEQLLFNSVKDVLNGAEHSEKDIDYTRYYLFKTYCLNFAGNILPFTGKYFKVIGAFFHKDLLKQFKFFDLKEMTNGKMHDYITGKNSKYLNELNLYNSGRKVKYAKLISNKITNKLVKKAFFKHPDLANYHQWLKKYHKDFLLDVLNYDKMVAAPLFNKQAFNKILDIYLKSKVSLSNKKKLLLGFSIERLIINLISLELWLRDISNGKQVKFV